MAELKEHAWLLALIALLLIAKFIIVPIYQWQDKQQAEISLLAKKQNKISKVLKEKDHTAKLNQVLDTVLKQAEGLISSYQEDAKFKLNQQKMLESLLSQFNLTTQHVGWQVDRTKDSPLFTSYPILIRFSGKTTDVIQFLAAIEINPQRIEVNDFNFSFKGQREKTLGRINGNVTLMLFMENKQNKDTMVKTNKKEQQVYFESTLFEPILFEPILFERKLT